MRPRYARSVRPCEVLEARVFLAAQFLGDLNPDGVGSDPRDCTPLGGSVYFSADDGYHGRELWKADPVAGTASLVRDILPGRASSDPVLLTPFKGSLYFFGRDAQQKYRLYRTDGTAGGTSVVSGTIEVPVDEVPATGLPYSTLVASGEALYFYGASDPGGTALYRTDGTAAGTTAFKPFQTLAFNGLTDVRRLGMADFNGRLVFTTPTDFWITDGTAAGTTRLYERFFDQNGQPAPNFAVVGNTLFFTARAKDFTDHGVELMKTDGTPGGTVLVKDIFPGDSFPGNPGSSAPYNLTNLNGTLFFYAQTDFDFEPWRSDGTAEGTVRVKDINEGTYGSYGSFWLQPPANQPFTTYNGVAYFLANGSSGYDGLWRSDGTADGTYRLYPNGPNITQGYGPGYLTVSGGSLYFLAYDDVVKQTGLMKIDLSQPPPQQVATFLGQSFITSIAAVPGGGVMFTGDPGPEPSLNSPTGSEPYVSDGTPAGTRMLTDLNPRTDHSLPEQAVELSNGTVVFVADRRLHRTDGTPAGTGPAAPVDEPREIALMTKAGDVAYFTARHGEASDYGLFTTDGTAAGTTLVRDFMAGGDEDAFYIGAITPAGDKVFLLAKNFSGHGELWVTDGTSGGTHLVKELGTAAAENPYFLTVAHNDRIYFNNGDVETGTVLWKSDGTAEGTVPVGEMDDEGQLTVPGVRGLFSDGDTLYVQAVNAIEQRLLRVDTFGEEIHEMIRGVPPDRAEQFQFLQLDDVNTFVAVPAGASGWSLYHIQNGVITGGPFPMGGPSMAGYNGKLYYVGVDVAHGIELWSYDPRSGERRLVKDVYAGEVSAFDFTVPTTTPLDFMVRPPYLAAGNGKLYFVARDASHGRHLFETDGTAEGTRISSVTDERVEGVPGSMPAILIGTNDNLFFASNHPRYGREVFALAPDATAPRILSAEYRPGGATPSFTVDFSENVGATLNEYDFRLARETASGLEDVPSGDWAVGYDPDTDTATIRMLRRLPDGRYVLSVEDGSAITDEAFNPLEPREVLRFQHLAMPGDTTGDGIINALDLADVRRRLNSTVSRDVGAGYSVSADANGDGRINALDLAFVKQRLNTRPPTTVAPAVPVESLALAAPVTKDLFSATSIL